jgi:glycerophosphoryl diester phosphodiesterase
MPDALDKLRRTDRVVRLHGHRGARGLWPENTLAGFQHTFDLDVLIVELDVLLTKDNIAVITHNPRLMAETTRNGDGAWLTQDGPRISDLSYADLSTFDIGAIREGSGYAQRYPDQARWSDQHIPKLADLAALIKQPKHTDVWLNIEIKSSPTQAGLTPAPQTLAAHVVEVIETHGLSKRVIVQSFDWRVLHHIARLAPHLPRSHLTYLERPDAAFEPNIYDNSPWMAGAVSNGTHSDLSETIKKAGGQIWSPFHKDITADQVAKAQRLGLIVNAWTVNTSQDITRMIDAGVDGIITDYPRRVQEHLIARGLHWREDCL